MLRAFKGTFKKKNGDSRDMNFVKLQDLPEAFLNSKVKDGTKKRELTNGMELVWDLDQESFRIFNHNTVVGSMTEYSYKGLLDSSKPLKNETEN
jgi:hypothetical protein|tara:strand:+ start:2775 stop:3056 length:282 start_codon:yes stop_codon:yes gene_type:complete